ncbi:hypothetical protein IL54_4369 [Sphingobium sp. ba1]|nr:hypothetical protein IL54_4369 [Sphingobium sp. ba1]
MFPCQAFSLSETQGDTEGGHAK